MKQGSDGIWDELLGRMQALSLENTRLSDEVTRLREAHAALHKASEAGGAPAASDRDQLFEQLTAALPVVFWILESETLRVLYVSPSFQVLTGRPPEALIADIRIWREIIHPDDIAEFAERLGRLRTLLDMSDSERVFRIVRTDGAVRDVRIMVFPIYDAAGRPYRRAAMIEDITERMAAEKKLRQSVDFQHSVFAGSQIGLLVLDTQYRVVAWNPYMAESTGLDASQVIGAHITDVMRSGTRDLFMPLLQRAMAGEVVGSPPASMVNQKTGRKLWGQAMCGPLRDAAGKLLGIIVIGKDITEQVRAEQELRKSEELFRSLAEHAPEGLAVITNARLAYVNLAMMRICGVERPEQVIGQLATGLLPLADRDRIAVLMAETIQRSPGAYRSPTEMQLLRQDGGMVHVQVQVVPFAFAGQTAFLALVHDLTERDHAVELADSLHREREQREHTVQALQMVEDLSRRLANAQETESHRVARVLHDDIGQLLTGLRLNLARVDSSLPEDSDIRTALRQAQELVEDVVERVRGLSLEMRPTILDDLGLYPTLRWLAERYERMMHIRVHLRAHRCDRRFPPELESGVYRIVQEALTNAARHAGVTELTLRLWATDAVLGVQVEDHGRGFQPDAVLATRQTSGLRSLLERARLLGGHCTVDSTPGEGTRITAELPLHSAGSSEPKGGPPGENPSSKTERRGAELGARSEN